MLIKSHYCSKWRLQLVKSLEANTPLEVVGICPSILSTSVLNLQSNVFKMIMKSNVAITIEAPFHVNPLTQLWHTLEASHILQHSFLEFFKLATIAAMQVLGSMEDERTFSTLSFMKSKLKNHFNEHLHTIVKTYSQTFYTLNTFLYDACFDDWKKQKPRRGLNYIIIQMV